MGTTTYYDLETFTYGGTGWNGAYSSNFEKIDDALNTISGTGADDLVEAKAYADSQDATLSGVLSSEIDSDISTHAGADSHSVYPLVDGSRMFADGADGWFDDGEFFRVTVSGGIITNIATTSSGGYSMS